MCTYVTVDCALTGSAKGPGSPWRTVNRATVYFDHPVHAMAEHTLNIDVSGSSGNPGDRVAIELSADSARALADAINAALSTAAV